MKKDSLIGAMRRTVAAVAVLAGLATGGPVPAAQSPAAPQFEVAAIRRNLSGEQDGAIGAQSNGRFVVRNVPLRFIIQVVHEVPAFRITGGPDWVDAEHYDIQAKAAEAVPEAQLHAMMRALLADRFKLALRREMRPVTGFALVRGRPNGPLGPQLRAHPEPCPPDPEPPPAPAAFDAVPPCGKMSGSDRLIRMTAGRRRPRHHPVATRRACRSSIATGLAGLFDVQCSGPPTRDRARR